MNADTILAQMRDLSRRLDWAYTATLCATEQHDCATAADQVDMALAQMTALLQAAGDTQTALQRKRRALERGAREQARHRHAA